MALSFEESKKQLSQLAATPMVMSLSNNDVSVVAYDNWEKPDNSSFYAYHNNEYYDDNVSIVDEEKNITLSNKQINLTQEKNSQYIPFEIPRYYDGFDLTTTELSIYWVNKDGYGSFAIPVDVYYNTDKIRFAWLVNDDVTSIAGKIQFEIQASGRNSFGDEYLWKTKSNDGINVIQALEFKKFIEPDDSWQDSFIQRIANEKNEAQKAASSAEQSAKDAQDAANQASGIKSEIDGVRDELMNGISEEVQTVVNNAMVGYATTRYVDDAVASINVSDQLEDYALKSELPTKVSALENDSKYVTESEMNNTVASVAENIPTKLSQLENDQTFVDKSYVEETIAELNISDQLVEYAKKEELPTKVSELENDTGYLTEHQSLDGLATETYVLDKLGNLIDNEGNLLTVEQYVEQEVKAIDVSDQLQDYAKSDNVYTKPEIDFKNRSLSNDIVANTENISSLSTTVGTLQNTVNSIDTSPRLTYDIVYNDTEDENSGENILVFYEIENEGKENQIKTPKKKYTITGGSGGSTSSNKLYIYFDKDKDGNNITQYVFTTENVNDNKAVIYYDFVGTDLVGDSISSANAVWGIRRGTSGAWSTIATETAYPNVDIEFNVSKYISSIGTYQLKLTVTDDSGGFATKTWTVQQIDFKIESSFRDADTYNGDVYFNYTPYGAIDKEVHFVLDGTALDVITTTNSGIPTSYTIPSQIHGSHLLDVYMTATINGTLITSNHIYKDILWRDSTSTIPVIGCSTPVINAMQYNTVNIKYVVFDPNTETPEVTWYINGEIASIETLTEKDDYGYYTYPYKANDYGTFELAVTCGEAKPKRITIEVEKLNINVSPVTAGLEFDFNPVGYSNGSADRLWSYNDVVMTVSDNFDWVNGGYQIDENGDQYFCVKAGTNAVINYNLFADDPKKTGKEFKVIFRTKNIRKRNTSFLTCLNENIGLDMKVENATIYNSGGSLKSDYCEDTIIEYEFNINKDTDMMIVMSYEDGAPSKPYEYTETSSFKQSSPQPITIGSKDCDIHIYRMKAYSISLTDTDIKNNFIADARNATEMIARYNRNQIYNEDGKVISTSTDGDFSVDALMKAAPDLRYIFLEVPQFTNDKDNKIDGCTVYFKYPAGTRPQDNWTCTGMRHRGQGTSSNLYGYAGRNIDLCMDRKTSLFTWVDEEGNTVESSTITLTDTSVPTDYLNIKVNIASSENANNAQMARRFNEYQPFLRYARKKDSKIKDTMEFYNCVVFIRETSTDLSNTPHREFNDTDWHFYAIGNVGDSKKTDDTRVNNANDPKEHIVEITDADKPLSAFPTGKESNAVCPIGEWHEGNTAYDILHSTEYVYDEEGAFESFGGTTYEFRYEMDGITEEQREVNINTWRNLYKFIVTSTDEEFYTNLKNYFVVDSALYFYLFTERYTMVDNRAKNSFWHYGKVYISESEAAILGATEASYYIVDNEAAAINDGYRYDLTFAYDMDTSLGIDNTGDYVFSYGKEDTDYYVDGDPTSDYVFRVADSVFFCRLRDLFPSEMQAMFKDREEKNAWDSTSLIDQWDKSQAQFPEELWRLDYERKYYRTYLGLSIDNSISQGIDKTFLIGKFFGRKKYARRAFEINQEIYFATKYFGNKALEDVFWIRGNVPIGSDIKPNYSLTLVPYSDMYVCVQYTSTGTPIHKKVKAGEICYFENDAERMDFIYVYAASYIQEVGDLSRCYVGDNNFSSATRLQKLVIGSTNDGYENTFMKEVLVANNPLLEHLDLRNISGINTVINVSSCSNLKELYAEGTNTTGAIFANGGLLQIAHLPNTITSLLMKNLNYIEDFVVNGGYDNLQTLIVEHTPNVNTYDIVVNAPLLKLLRLINLNWDSTYQIIDASIFDRLLTIGGIDSSGYETDPSVLTGNAYTAIVKEQQLYNYQSAWPDLEITYGTLKKQYPVTFKNADGSILQTQYVVIGETAVDISQYDEAGNPTYPTAESSVQYNYRFKHWALAGSDEKFDFSTLIRSDIELIAVYEPILREYTIKYSAMGIVMQESTGKYGDNIVYSRDDNEDGIVDIPAYTSEESGDVYYLFRRWDKSGLIDGEKTVNAIFDKFEYDGNVSGLVELNENIEVNGSYTKGSFKGLELSDLYPVHIYALTKLGASSVPIGQPNDDGTYNTLQDKSSYTIIVGHDIDYDDVESKVLIAEKTHFNGSNYIDTGIQLFDEDQDFVLAIDYSMGADNTNNNVLAQCFSGYYGSGLRLWYNNGVKFGWGSSSETMPATNNREIAVIRHVKGETGVHLYVSNTSDSQSKYVNIASQDDMQHNQTLVFGCSKADDGSYENGAIGTIYWSKVWYADLGDEICSQIACWPHEQLNFEMCGFKRYYLSDGSGQRTSMSFLASTPLNKPMAINNTSSNSGGWAECALNTFLNNRIYNAIPTIWKQLVKQVQIKSSAGNKSSAITNSNCYIAIPAIYEVDAANINSEPYISEGTSIKYFSTNDTKICYNEDGEAVTYWTRSPNIGYDAGNYVIRESGTNYGFYVVSSQYYIRIMISI